MKVLLTNHRLLDYAGSEIFTYTLADYLKRKGCEVVVYSKYVNRLASDFRSIGILLVRNLEEIKGERFDIAHVHHNINAMEVRYHFPLLPMIFLSHGILPFLEQPPQIDLGISRFLAVSEEVKNHLIKHGIKEDEISIFRNMIDSQKFCPWNKISHHPRKALILSNKIDKRRENVIRRACENLNIQCKFVGVRFGRINYALIPNCINEADIVFSLGRGVIETMLCGRIPIVFDCFGGDGMVTPDNMTEIMKFNFSGRKYRINYTVDQLVLEMKKYEQSHGDLLREMSIEHFSAEIKIGSLLQLYEETKKSLPKQIDESHRDLLDTYMKLFNRPNRGYMIEERQAKEFAEEFVELKSSMNWRLAALFRWTLDKWNRIRERS